MISSALRRSSSLLRRVTPVRATSLFSTASANQTRFQSSRINYFGGAVFVAAISSAAFILSNSASNDAEAAQPSSGLDPTKFKSFKLSEIRPYNYNTKVYVFDLEDKEAYANFPVASFVLTKAKIGEKDIIRPYTPINQNEQGKLVLLVKTYAAGNMSKHMDNMKVGDELEIKGPLPKLKYTANMKKHIGMVAGGTGITPMLQVIEEIAKNPEDKTQVDLIFANVSERDILLKEELDQISSQHSNVKVHYILDQPSSAWTGLSGHVNADLIKSTFPQASEDNMVFVCGPPGMMAAVSGTKAPDFTQGEVNGMLKELGYTKEQVFKF